MVKISDIASSLTLENWPSYFLLHFSHVIDISSQLRSICLYEIHIFLVAVVYSYSTNLFYFIFIVYCVSVCTKVYNLLNIIYFTIADKMGLN